VRKLPVDAREDRRAGLDHARFEQLRRARVAAGLEPGREHERMAATAAERTLELVLREEDSPAAPRAQIAALEQHDGT
jgi:hypothetical protein